MNKFQTAIFTSLTLVVSGIGLSHAINTNTEHHHAINTKLTESGNDAFGTMQEVLQNLLVDPETDWSKVNMEALRQHLVDMKNFTMDVDIISKKPINAGVQVVLEPHNQRVRESLDRVFSAHPAQLKKETGWDMKIQKLNNQYIISITTDNSEDIVKIRGLGYIGIMTWGNHHQPHHWMMAKGENPH